MEHSFFQKIVMPNSIKRITFLEYLTIYLVLHTNIFAKKQKTKQKEKKEKKHKIKKSA